MKIKNAKKYKKYIRKTQEQSLRTIRDNIRNKITTKYPKSDNKITIFVTSRMLRIETDLTETEIKECTTDLNIIEAKKHKTIYNEPRFVEIIKC